MECSDLCFVDTPNQKQENIIVEYNFMKRKKINSILYFIKNRLFVKFISIKIVVKFFLLLWLSFLRLKL